jgi:DNA modification methylase
MSEKNYITLRDASKHPSFKRDYAELKKEYAAAKKSYYENEKHEFDKNRYYFDNGHEVMSDVFEFERVKGDERHGHATPKPVEMMIRIVKTSAKKGGIVVEPFSGSGSTLIACEKAGRRCYAMELSPAYCDVAVKRWENLTGKKAEIERNDSLQNF